METVAGWSHLATFIYGDKLNYHSPLHDYNICLLISYTATVYEWDNYVAFSFKCDRKHYSPKVGNGLEVNIKFNFIFYI